MCVSKTLVEGEAIKLNLGCGDIELDNFINLDKKNNWWFQDGLPEYVDCSVDVITISHALMYLDKHELFVFLEEAYRVLKSNGVIRITEDDTENPLSDTYKTGWKKEAKVLTGPKMMGRCLIIVGFKVCNVEPNETNYVDDTLIQNFHGTPPRVFHIEGIK